MTPYSKSTSSDRWKVQQDVDSVLGLFKAFLKTHRPSLNVDAVATGETWHGPQAMKMGLVDELCTSDEYVLRVRGAGAEVFSVRLEKQPVSGVSQLLSGRAAEGEDVLEGGNPLLSLMRYLLQAVVRDAVADAMGPLGGTGVGMGSDSLPGMYGIPSLGPAVPRYMAADISALTCALRSNDDSGL
jgi:ClpP class serine protease